SSQLPRGWSQRLRHWRNCGEECEGVLKTRHCSMARHLHASSRLSIDARGASGAGNRDDLQYSTSNLKPEIPLTLALSRKGRRNFAPLPLTLSGKGRGNRRAPSPPHVSKLGFHRPPKLDGVRQARFAHALAH